MDDYETKQERFWMSRGERGKATDLWRYIPQKYWDAISDCDSNEDGYWVYLEEGYRAYDGGEDCKQILCYTIADLKKDIKTIRKIK